MRDAAVVSPEEKKTRRLTDPTHSLFFFYILTTCFLFLRAILQSVGELRSEIEIDNMIRAADVDCDGSICFNEFVKLMLS